MVHDDAAIPVEWTGDDAISSCGCNAVDDMYAIDCTARVQGKMLVFGEAPWYVSAKTGGVNLMFGKFKPGFRSCAFYRSWRH